MRFNLPVLPLTHLVVDTVRLDTFIEITVINDCGKKHKSKCFCVGVRLTSAYPLFLSWQDSRGINDTDALQDRVGHLSTRKSARRWSRDGVERESERDINNQFGEDVETKTGINLCLNDAYNQPVTAWNGNLMVCLEVEENKIQKQVCESWMLHHLFNCPKNNLWITLTHWQA